MSGVSRNYYKILGVPPSASSGEIHRAFRRLARELHPDVNPGRDAAARFDELSSAYAVLHNPRERARYDRSSLGVRNGGSPGVRQAPDFTSRRPTVRLSLVIRMPNPFRRRR